MKEHTLHDLYFSSVTAKRECASALYARISPLLVKDSATQHHLLRLKEFSRLLADHMNAMGMNDLCHACGSKKGGGCCSALMANETDAVQLLINMLLGIDITPRNDDGVECCYLGSAGCIFPVKPIFCLNYNCRQITSGAQPNSLIELEKRAAALLRQQTALEEHLLRGLEGKAWGGEEEKD